VAVILALLSSLFWGSADFGGGVISRQVSVASVVLFSQASGAVALAGVCALSSQPFPHYYALAMAAGVCGVAGLLLFYRGLAIGKMSLVAPVAGCGAALPVLYSIATGQVPRPLTLLGLASALVGIVLSSMASGSVSPGASAHPREAALSAIGAAVCFGLFLLLLGRAAAADPHAVLWLSLFTRVASVPVLAVGLLLARVSLPWAALDPRRGVRLPAFIALVGLGDATANTLFALANTVGSLAVVAVLGSLYPLVTAMLARLRLGERLNPRQKTGAGLAMLGVILVSLPQGTV
jgi:drug/metabolite transporter (DMT)-like permease